MSVIADILGDEHWNVFHQLLDRLPRPLLLIVMALSLNKHVHLTIGIHGPFHETLYQEALGRDWRTTRSP